RRLIFSDDEDRYRYIGTLVAALRQYRWLCLAYCLMPNHVHLLIKTPETNLASGMRYLHGRYAREFNERHGRTGHLFESRYGSSLVLHDNYLWVVAAYIALNPVHAGLVDTPAAYLWSSHHATVTGDGPSWLASAQLLEYFGGVGGDPRQRYAQFVDGQLT
ncbi:MAG: REP-associated tyrosine transposase, partial [Solirubrobacteraceae bacterium]|nr:REP-associated tyrosine transposase [Solirubrobacteraceae bacterium]